MSCYSQGMLLENIQSSFAVLSEQLSDVAVLKEQLERFNESMTLFLVATKEIGQSVQFSEHLSKEIERKAPAEAKEPQKKDSGKQATCY